MDYILGGCEVGVQIAIDYTLSNGHPSKSESLHFLGPHKQNEYTKAIEAVLSVLADYDSD